MFVCLLFCFVFCWVFVVGFFVFLCTCVSVYVCVCFLAACVFNSLVKYNGFYFSIKDINRKIHINV